MLRRRTNLQKIHKNCLWTFCVQTQRNENRKSERKISRPRLKKASVNAENVKLRLKEKKHVSASSEKKVAQTQSEKSCERLSRALFYVFANRHRRKSLMYDALESLRGLYFCKCSDECFGMLITIALFVYGVPLLNFYDHIGRGLQRPRRERKRFRKGFIYGPLFCQPRQIWGFSG